jgi:hypothetical protein
MTAIDTALALQAPQLMTTPPLLTMAGVSRRYGDVVAEVAEFFQERLAALKAAYEIIFIDKDGNAGTNNITIARNGKEIASDASDLVINTNYAACRLRYRTATTDWEFMVL